MTTEHKPSLPQFLLIPEYMTKGEETEIFEKFCKKNNIDDPKKAVFVFPGNSGHHGKENSLFSQKSGGGLGIPARKLGDAGIPVLSLPTVDVGEPLKTGDEIPALAKQAMADLCKAAGYGFNIVLPVREKKKRTRTKEGTDESKEFAADTFFPEGCHFPSSDEDKKLLYEPSFWGADGINSQPNPILAQYYFDHLGQLKRLMSHVTTLKNEKEREEFFKQLREGKVGNNKYKDLHDSYLEGLAESKESRKDPWFEPVVKGKSANIYGNKSKTKHNFGPAEKKDIIKCIADNGCTVKENNPNSMTAIGKDGKEICTVTPNEVVVSGTDYKLAILLALINFPGQELVFSDVPAAEKPKFEKAFKEVIAEFEEDHPDAKEIKYIFEDEVSKKSDKSSEKAAEIEKKYPVVPNDKEDGPLTNGHW